MFAILVRDVAFGFDVRLPLAAEAIEVVDEVAAHERLHGGVDVGEIDLLLKRLFPIDIRVELRHGRLIRRNGGGDLRPF